MLRGATGCAHMAIILLAPRDLENATIEAEVFVPAGSWLSCGVRSFENVCAVLPVYGREKTGATISFPLMLSSSPVNWLTPVLSTCT